ncbi:hypothetical protein AKO1_006698, partial [Acrasis kona]
MSFWNAPNDVKDHELLAVLAGFDMARRAERINKLGIIRHPLKVRVGINSDVCLIGNIGSANRVNYTCLGDGVNLASRVEALNTYFGTTIAVTHRTKRAVHKKG